MRWKSSNCIDPPQFLTLCERCSVGPETGRNGTHLFSIVAGRAGDVNGLTEFAVTAVTYNNTIIRQILKLAAKLLCIFVHNYGKYKVEQGWVLFMRKSGV